MKIAFQIGVLQFLKGDYYVAHLCQEGGKRVAFISANEVNKLTDWVDYLQVLQDANREIWFEITHPKLRAIRGGGTIPVVNGNLEEVDDNNSWAPKENCPVWITCWNNKDKTVSELHDEWYGPTLKMLRESPSCSKQADLLMHENGKRTIREQRILDDSFEESISLKPTI